MWSSHSSLNTFTSLAFRRVQWSKTRNLVNTACQKQVNGNEMCLFSRVLLVQKENGSYGLTLSGDKPVFVQTVRLGGPADRAGIRENDVIIRVNGTRVLESLHTEVVNMIQGKLWNPLARWNLGLEQGSENGAIFGWDLEMGSSIFRKKKESSFS